MSATDSLTRLREIAGILARRSPPVLTATTTLLESVLEAADPSIAADRIPTAPVTLTAEQVLEVARTRGVPAFAGAAGDWLILLASLGLDLTDPGVGAALVEMYRRHELRLVRIGDVAAVRADLAARDLPIDLVDESAIVDGDITFSRGGDLVTSRRHPWRRIRGASVHATLAVALDVALVALVGHAQAVAT